MKYLFCLALGAILMASCGDASEELTSVNYARNFAPVGVEAKVRNNTNVELSWTVMAEAAHYIVEVYEDDELEFAGTPIQTLTVLPEEVPYTVTGLMGETWYSFRVKSVDANAAKESKWSTASIETGKEQIFKSVADEDIKAKQVTLRWPAGEAAATITLTPGDIEYTVTDADIAAGAATITGLTPETEYTAVMKRSNGLTRGTITFTTAIDLAETDILVKEGESIVDAINNAPEGYRLILMPGEYGIPTDEAAVGGNITINKAISIKGLRQNDHPVIKGRFNITNGASLELDQVTLDGNDAAGKPNADQAFVFKKDGDMSEVGYLRVLNSEVKNYAKGFFYIADSELSHVKEIKIDNCIISNIECSGGDLFDARKGAAVEELTISNNTVYNSCLERDFIRYDDGSSNFKSLGTITCKITVDHNTLVGVANVASRRIFYTRFKKHTNTFTNNIVVNTLANFSNQGGTAVPTFDNNVYFEASGLCVSGANANGKFIDDKAKVLDPKFVDAAKGDFTIGNDDVKDTKAGDPRWMK